MSALLFDESPLVLQRCLVRALGSVDQAILVQQLHYLLLSYRAVEHDGHRWIVRGYADWLADLDWLKERTLRRYWSDLEARGIVIIAQYGAEQWDRRNWYRIDYAVLDALPTGTARRIEPAKIAASPARGTGQNSRIESASVAGSSIRRDSKESKKERKPRVRAATDYLIGDADDGTEAARRLLDG